MAARLVPFLIGAALLAGEGVTSAQDEPTALERVMQQRYLDRYFLLRVDVKVEALRTHNVLATSAPRRPSLSRIRPITVVTPDGVFYSADYDRSTQLNVDVRIGASLAGSSPGDSVRNQVDMLQGGNIGDVVELNLKPYTTIQTGDLARVIGVEETTPGIRVTLEGFGTEAVQVLLRGVEAPGATPEELAQSYATLLGLVFHDLPVDRARRMEWIDPDWPARVQTAIREQRVVEGMGRLQVLLAWGTPLFISRESEGGAEIWLFKRGESILDQLRNRVNVYFGDGKVIRVGDASGR